MKNLKMIFTLNNGKTLTYSLADPKEGLARAEVETVMQSMVDKQAIVDAKGAKAAAIKDCYIYESGKQQLA